MPLEFQVEILARHVRSATRGIFWRQVGHPALLGLAAAAWVGAHGVLQALFPATPLSMHLTLAVLFCVTLGGMAWLTNRHYQALALRNFSRIIEAPAQVRLEADAYHYSAPWGEGRIGWGQFQSLWRFKDVWVLLQHSPGGVSVLLPAASLDQEAREFLLQRLRSSGAAVKG